MHTHTLSGRLLTTCGALTLVGAATLLGAARFPEPVRDSPKAAAKATDTAVLAGGCFWGVEAVFENLAGVSDVVSGYAGGAKATARYELVSNGNTGHAEAVKVTFDPSQITYGQLLKVFFSVAHDPTELNRQGPDEGPQYRSTIFYSNDEQKAVAAAYVTQLNGAKVFKTSIATTMVPLQEFYLAEAKHQDFLVQHPTYPYIVYHDLPKLGQLKAQWPELLKKK